MSEIARIEPNAAPAAVQSESAALISMIERAARDPNVDIGKMERLFEMQQKAQAQRAKAAYLAALAVMQPALPVVNKAGVIKTNEKDERGNKTGVQIPQSKYARWEDVVETVNPVLTAHGFSLSFRIAQPTPDRITVTAVLGHRDGHSEETAMSLPIDSSGAKNNVQGWGSSVSYGKRYTAFALLNIVARGEDDDAASFATGRVTPEQITELQALLKDTGTDAVPFLDYYAVGEWGDLTAKQYADAKAKLVQKKRQAVRK